ncbi:MAG: HAMP domain-containing histidine kinase [Deltaproteobacteria bacterium]|nr:HAMP domain-containing histidine kinase [Deltaproteobacteria bacterium]
MGPGTDDTTAARPGSTLRLRAGLVVTLVLPSLVATAAVTALLFHVAEADPGGASPRAAQAERDALRVLAGALSRLPPGRRVEAVAVLSRGFAGRLVLVGPGRPPSPVEGFSRPVTPPWRVPAEGLAEARGGGADSVLVAGAPFAGPDDGAGVVSIVVPAPADRASRLPWFALAFGIIVIGLSLLPVLVVAQRFAADLRRLERGLAGLFAADETAGAPAEPTPRLPQAGDELGLFAWIYESVRGRLDADLRRYRKARAHLARADQDKIDFLAVMSHELRTPLNTIIGFSEVLLEGLEGPLAPGQREDLRIIRESGDHLLNLVNDILDLSALHAGQIRIEPAETDAVEVARAVMDEAEGQLRDKPVRLVMQFEHEQLHLRADARLLRRVLQNLVGNALKFTQHGEVRLELHREGDQAVLSVSDTGPGIAADALAAVFEEYRQTGDTRTRREGTGLGLAIVRRLAQMHGGDVTARSTLGEGSTFIVRLPLAGPPAGDRDG